MGAVSVILFGVLSFAPQRFINKIDNSILLAGSHSFQLPERQGEPFVGLIKVFAESPDFNLVQQNSLKASTPPLTVIPQVLGALATNYEPEDTRRVITEYVVEEGDTLRGLSASFNISLNTILWANNLTEKSKLKPGQKLVILPVSGVIHHVKSGDTLSEIARLYKGKTEEIVAFNSLVNENDIYVGDIIIVPNGVMPPPKQQQVPSSLPLASSYFIAPVTTPYKISQGLHWYNAIDFDGQCGNSIYAAAEGQILKVALTNSVSRWVFGGAGNHITIQHPNGVVTTYGHIASSLVSQGERVSQGQRIALMGGQPGTPGAGVSTGCHLHFGVQNARNPFAR